MEGKNAGGGQAGAGGGGVYSTQPAPAQSAPLVQQLLHSHYQEYQASARSPLLDHRHELYGSAAPQPHDYARHYPQTTDYSYPGGLTPREPHADLNHDLQNMPKGYNAEVYQDYLRRNPPKDTNQIYQNHQPMHREQYAPRPYVPYRAGPQSNTELLKRQYSEIQQMKLQQQMHFQSQAQQQQQQKFAERQILLQQLHGVQPPPNLQNSLYGDIDRYNSKEFYSSADIQKDVDRYAKNNDYKEMDKHSKQFQEPQWQPSPQTDFREADRYRQELTDQCVTVSPPELNNQRSAVSPVRSSDSSPSARSPLRSTAVLRAPALQRQASAPVAMAGLLHKQGSDGLKVWRKRWFVLSEYCLFYYKSQDEDKLLGSVLLPSYRVSACSAEDRVLRKHAFKLEHANMRTYVLAAPDHDAMVQWVKALTMAALMQSPSEPPQQYGEQQTTAKQELDEEVRGPTYANAPPKPRRSNEGYNSPSPDMYDPNYDLLKKPASQYSQHRYDPAIYGSPGSDPRNRGTTNHEPTNYGSTNNDHIQYGSTGHGSTNYGSTSHEPTNHLTNNHDPANYASMSPESTPYDSTGRDPTNYGSSTHDSAINTLTSPDPTQYGSTGHDSTKYGSMGHDSRKYGPIIHEPKKYASTSHDPQYPPSPHHPHQRHYHSQQLSLPLTNTVADKRNQPSTSSQRSNQYVDRSQPQPPLHHYDKSLNPFLDHVTPDTDTPTDTDIHIPAELQENSEAYNYKDTRNATLPDPSLNRDAYDYKDSRNTKVPDQSLTREASVGQSTRNAKLPELPQKRDTYDYQDSRNAKLPDQPLQREAYHSKRNAKLPDLPNTEPYDYQGTRNTKFPLDQSLNPEAYNYQDTRNAKSPEQPLNREAYDHKSTRNAKLPDIPLNKEPYNFQGARNAKLPHDSTINRESYDYQDTRNAKLPDHLSNREANEYPSRRNAKLPTQPYKVEVYGDLARQRSVSSMNERMVDRRTPDAYGRAAAMMAYNKNKAGDYEDVYSSYTTENDYGKTYQKSSNPFQAPTTQQPVQDSTPTQYSEKTFSGPSVLRRKKMAAIGVQGGVPRPHSADFLEYEARQHLTKTLPEPLKQPQRPKSSLDINSFYDPSSDRYYSEESYAQKMRQSAQYLNPVIGPRNIQIPLAKYASGLAEKQLNSPYPQTTNNNYEMGFGPNRTLDNNSNTTYGDVDGLNAALNCNWTLKEKALENQNLLLSSGGVLTTADGNRSVAKDPRSDPAADTFLRSSSARLPSNTSDKGEKRFQQREESMKRLLEWKERMLQSPLTRKSTPAAISLARSLNNSRQSMRSDQYRPRGYGDYISYSSDDEEETTGTDLQRPSEIQAGRSQILSVTGANIPRPVTPHSPPPAPLVAHPHDVQTTDNTYENIHCTNNIHIEQTSDPKELSRKEEDENCTEDDQDGCETQDSEAESEGQMEYTDNDLDEVLLESDAESQHAQPTAEPQADNEQDTNIDQNEDKSETPPARPPGEDHYMPMSPRKTSTIEPAHKTILQNLSVFNQSAPHGYEDNPYVEMNAGNEEEDTQTYEVVCVNNGKVEPVYMELSNFSAAKLINPEDITNPPSKFLLDTASNFADTKDLTLKRASKGDKSTKEKSDCSDADDEASKEISLDAPFSRFSISDNFRPASYYLSASLKSSETVDSSDSETLSTVMKPSFTPPCDELTGEALSKYILDKIDSSDMSQDNSILKMLTNENQQMNTVKRKATSLMIYGSRTSIHDTLSRGEKIRNSRASLTNDKKMAESPVNLVGHSILEHFNSSSVESDSLRSYNADRGSSRLSLESDISSKFEMAPSNVSSEVTSLNECDLVDFRYPRSYEDLEIMAKRRPVSDDSIFELSASSVPVETFAIDTSNLATNLELDRYLDILQPGTSMGHFHKDTSMLSCSAAESSYKDNMVQATQFRGVSHTRCSSNPVSHSATKGSNNEGCARKIDAPISGYVGSHSSCSSGGLTKSPMSYYCKDYDEEKTLSKNLNNDVLADKIKEFDCEKIALKSGMETNTSSTTTGFHSRESSTEHSAPYYYSDLSSQEHINLMPTSHYLKNTNLHRKLNNQRRRGPFHKKTDISHIHNPIRNSDMLLADRSFDLATSARSVSVEFLSATDKDPEIDMKNIYASGVRNSKIPESMSLISGLGCKRNSSNFESSSPDSNATHRSSLNTSSAIKISNASMSSHCSGNSSNTVYYDAEAEASETRAYENIMCQGEKHWDEDSLWRDNLRRVSHRHARSMDDLDTVPSETPLSPRDGVDMCGMNSIKRVKKHIPNKITRNVTYVNCDIQNEVLRRIKNNTSLLDSLEDNKDDNDVYVSLAENAALSLEQSDEGVYEQLAVSSDNSLTMPSQETIDRTKIIQARNKRRFEIDREKLRQWDLMSSGLLKGGGGAGTAAGRGAGGPGAGQPAAEASMTLAATNVDLGTNNIVDQQQLSPYNIVNQQPLNPYNLVNQPPLNSSDFAGSNTTIGRAARDVSIPVSAVSPRLRRDTCQDPYSRLINTSQQNLNLVNGTEDVWSQVRSPSRTQQPIRAVSPRIRRNTEYDEMREEGVPTAGELLGRTHEELVLLLIQLRRRHATTTSAIQQCSAQIRSLEDCLPSLKGMERDESIQRLEQLKHQLSDLESQYEKSKPLVQLVDNMVKLGSLYNRPGTTVERLERNLQLREKVLAEHAVEQQRWLESAAAGQPLETDAARARVAELWALEQELSDEASILQGLRTDKDALETLLTGGGGNARPAAMSPLSPLSPRPGLGLATGGPGPLEAELARVHALLALNTKKLEQTVAENARLDCELQQLRRALHARRASTRQPQTAHPTAMLENEVSRVQQLVSQRQRQRQELSRAIRVLTRQSHALQLTQDAMPGKRRPSSSWQETNLDTGHTTDHRYQESNYNSRLLYPSTNIDSRLNANYPSTNVDSRLNPNYPSTNVDSRLNTYPSTNVDSRLNPNYPSTNVDSRLNTYPSTNVDCRLNPNYPSTNVDSRLNANYPPNNVDSRLNAKYPSTNIDSRLNTDYPSTNVDSRLNPNYTSTNVDSRLNANYPSTNVDSRLNTSYPSTSVDSRLNTSHESTNVDNRLNTTYPSTNVDTPLYVDTREDDGEDLQNSAFSNLSNVEKQEIKTVRIVKRESERRQRDRDRSLQPLADWPHTEYLEDSPTNTFTRSASLPRPDYSRLNLDPQEREKFEKFNSRYEDTQSYYSKLQDKDKSNRFDDPQIYYSQTQERDKSNVFQEFYSKPQEKEKTSTRFEEFYSKPLEKEKSNMDTSPKFPSSPSLSNYDFSQGISSLSSSYTKSYQEPRSYDRSTVSTSSQFLNSPDSSKTLTNEPLSLSKASSVTSLSLTRSTMELSPIFKSEAAKQIITEMCDAKPGSLHRRQVPKERRRHYTAPHHLSAKVLSEMPKEGYNLDKMGRSVDDVDMERALRGTPAPDVVRSTQAARFGADSIDQLLAAPRKILIPERYIPEKPPELSPEEQQKRQEKVESIKKMLSGTPADSSTKSPDGEEKRQREHLLQMNQILAKQVTEMSKIIAVKALEELPQQNGHADPEDRSPDVELPIYQQRDNFFT